MSNLWAINSQGKAFTLSTADEEWTEIRDHEIEFKRVSAHEFFTWAVSGDQQIYVFVPTRDVPIRCCLVTFENERWNPVHGFSDRLLPTDRPRWSSADGLVSLPQESFKLPSRSWEWEEEWYVEDNLEGQPLEPEGWTYAIDFPARYGPSKSWNSLVRRRRWVRYMRFWATNKWSLVPSVHQDPIEEPFLDVGVGGTEVPGGDPELFSVWAVTIHGRLVFRYGVTIHSPEGSGWVPISTPEEVNQVSVGPTGLVWALTWGGRPLVRMGVTRENIMGTHWVFVDPPSEEDKLSQVTVGTNAVWAIGKENKVWFRKEVRGLSSGEKEQDATGCGWVQMYGQLAMVSMGLNDQVFSVSSDFQHLSVRTGVDSSELCGKTWRHIEASSKSLSSLDSSHQDSASSSEISLNSFRKSSCPPFMKDERECIEMSHKDSVSCTSLDSLTQSTELWFPMADMESPLWIWVSAGGCLVNSEALPHWFSRGRCVSNNAADEPWYEDLLMQFRERRRCEMKFSYPKAIEKGTWVKTVTCRWFKDHYWVGCLLELIQHEEDSRSILTFHHKKEQVTIPLKNIVCAVCLPDWNKTVLAVYASKKTHKFSFTSYDDLEEWVAILNCARRHVNHVGCTPQPGSLWSVSSIGDVYTSDSGWNLLGGGHLRIVETSCSGVTWGLGYNCTAWVYTQGYGGGPYRGIPGCNVNIGPMHDARSLYIYENQRWNPLFGFSSKGLPTDRYMWSDDTGRVECTKDNTKLRSHHWQWTSNWSIDYKVAGGTSNEGWQYATDFPRSYHSYRGFTDYVRRRRWYRKCKVMATGPWKQLGSTSLLDVSFQIDAYSEHDPVAVWAIAANGDVLYRSGVTKLCPAGIAWTHVPSEKPFRSISVGGEGAVWAVAKDGSAQLRHGVSSEAPTGQYWCHVEAPQNHCPLVQISAGKTIVLAVDASHKLWARQEIVPVFREGTHWKWLSDDVQQVSVGPSDQVWSVLHKSGCLAGVIARRSESGWQQEPGGCWNHISVRGCLLEEE